MKTRSLVCSLMLLGSGGCVVPHSLGMSEAESADEGGEGGSSSGGTGGVSMSDTGGGVSDGDGGESGPVASDGEDTDPTMPTSADVDDGDGEDSGGFDQCNPLGEHFVWLWDSMQFDSVEKPLVGEVLVSGICDVVYVDSDPLDPSIKGFALSCIVDGRMDGLDVTDAAFDGFFAAGGDLVQEALEARMTTIEVNDEPVHLKFAQGNWGQGLERWFVIADEEGELLLDGVNAEEIDPADDVLLANDFEVLPELLPWHGALTLLTMETDCDTFADEECGGVQQSLYADGPELEAPAVVVEVGGSGFIEGAAGPLNVFLDAALDYSQATCEDLPLALVRYASYAP